MPNNKRGNNKIKSQSISRKTKYLTNKNNTRAIAEITPAEYLANCLGVGFFNLPLEFKFIANAFDRFNISVADFLS